MPDFRIIIDIKGVAFGDAESVAQDTWDRECETVDPGDFKVRIVRVDPSGAQFDTDWEPRE